MNTVYEKGKEARQKILDVALELFANEGYSKASTRKIADKAQVNLSAIKYYFGDKYGLYVAAFREPFNIKSKKDFQHMIDRLSLDEVLKQIYLDIIEPLRTSGQMRLCMKLHMREMLEPTGFWDNEIENEIKPQHEAVVLLLKKEIGKEIDDDRLNRLTFSIMGLGVFLYLGQDVIGKIKPELLESDMLDIWVNRLVQYAKALIEVERKL